MAGNGTYRCWHHYCSCTRFLVHNLPREHTLQHPLRARLQHSYVPLCNRKHPYCSCLDAERTHTRSGSCALNGRSCEQRRKHSCCGKSVGQAFDVGLSDCHHYWSRPLWFRHRLLAAKRMVYSSCGSIRGLPRCRHQHLLLYLHSSTACAFG